MPTSIDVISVRVDLSNAIYNACRGGRGSGRTRRLVQALPRWAYVVVPNAVMGMYVGNMILECRGAAFLDTCTIASVVNMRGFGELRSTTRPVRVDHSVWESTNDAYNLELFRVLVDRAVHRLESARRELDSQGRSWITANSRWFIADEVSIVTSNRALRVARPEVFTGPEPEDL